MIISYVVTDSGDESIAILSHAQIAAEAPRHVLDLQHLPLPRRGIHEEELVQIHILLYAQHSAHHLAHHRPGQVAPGNGRGLPTLLCTSAVTSMARRMSRGSDSEPISPYVALVTRMIGEEKPVWNSSCKEKR